MARETKADRIQKQIVELQVELRTHQSKCKHKRATYTYGANTGNYDPSSDCYWIDFRCPTCQKRWTVYDNQVEEWDKARLSLKHLTEVKR